MASNTPNLELYKVDPASDGNLTFNIKTMLNDNWDKIDAAVIAKLLEAKGYTDTKIAELINAAPGALDTLKELADALGDDPNFRTTIINMISQKLDTSSYTASDVLTKLKTVDGPGSGLDADTLDGKHAAATLNTTEKNDLAGAINEVKSTVDSHLADIVSNPAPDKILRLDGNSKFPATILAEGVNADITKSKTLELKTDTRNTILTYDINGILTKIEEKDGSTVVKTTNLNYTNGNLASVEEIAGGTTVTTTLTYTNGNLTGVSKVVS